MNKKLKYLAAIPLYGTCILLIYMFVLCLKEEISKKRFFKTFFICAIVSAICWYMVMMIVYIISKKIINFNFNKLGLIITMIIGGYMMNTFTFIYVDKKWDYLAYEDIKEEKSMIEVNQKKIIRIGLILAILITILAFVAIIVFKLI